jgi:hypothetical protein
MDREGVTMTHCHCPPQRTRWFRRRILVHNAECPNAYSHLHTAEDIAKTREMWALWKQGQQAGGLPDAFVNGLIAKVEQGISRRASELGLEPA